MNANKEPGNWTCISFEQNMIKLRNPLVFINGFTLAGFQQQRGQPRNLHVAPDLAIPDFILNKAAQNGNQATAGKEQHTPGGHGVAPGVKRRSLTATGGR